MVFADPDPRSFNTVRLIGASAIFRGLSRPTPARGDWLTLGAALCWAVYTVVGQPLLARYGLFRTNAYSIAIGALFFLPFGVPSFLAISPTDVPLQAWAGTLFSMLFALVVAYNGWHYAVSRIGPTQTSIYSNLMPVRAVTIAFLWLGEPAGGVHSRAPPSSCSESTSSDAE